MELLSQHNFEQFGYNIEKRIKINKTNNILSVYAGGTLKNNTYKWFNDSVLVKTIKKDSVFTPTVSGNYSVQVTNAVATELTLYSDTLRFTALKSAEQNDNASIKAADKNNLSIYPNPAKNIVTIAFVATGNYIIKLTDVSGNILETKTGVGVEGKNMLRFDVSKYAAGVYFIIINDKENREQTLRFNKQ
jgi:hypothetical protein